MVARTEPSSWRSSLGHGSVGNHITDGVAPCQDCQTKDCVTQTEDDSKCLEQADKFIGNDVDPDDGDDEAHDGKELVVDGRTGPGGEANHSGQEEGEYQCEMPDQEPGVVDAVIGHCDGKYRKYWTWSRQKELYQ